MKKNSTLLGYVAAVLIVLYGVSFIPAIRGHNMEKHFQSALMNKKYENILTEIEIAGENTSLKLYRRNENDLWKGVSNGSVFPVDNGQIQAFISSFTKVRNMYKISDSEKKWDFFSLSAQHSVVIVYKLNNDMSTKIYFGGQNFLKNRRYLRIDNKISSYEIDSDLDVYLTTKESFWYDPYIIPQNVTASSIEDIQSIRINGMIYNQKTDDFEEKCTKLLELRHGEIASIPNDGKKVYLIEVESGDGLYICIQVYKTAEGKILLYTFKNTLDGKKYDYNYAVKISNWTFEKIEKLFPSFKK
ncbi:MAG: DUF4340 domain-containing protein [Treponema sp.]|nr:DUF4340 domain-containing protein [Treponema sp.]